MYTGTDRPPQKAKHHAPRHLSQSLGTARPMHILSTLHAQPWNALASHQRIPMTLPDPPMRPWRLRPDLLRPHHTSCPPNAATSPSPRQVAVIVSRVAGITPRGACSGQRHARPACVSDLVLTCTCTCVQSVCSLGMSPKSSSVDHNAASRARLFLVLTLEPVASNSTFSGVVRLSKSASSSNAISEFVP